MEAFFSLASVPAGATPPKLSRVLSQLADTHDTAGIRNFKPVEKLLAGSRYFFR